MGETRLKGPTFITCIDTTTQAFASANTEQPITLNTRIDGVGIIEIGNGEFRFTETGIYKLIMFPILTKSIGTTISHFLWLQEDLGVGAGFVDIPDSNSETVLLATETNDIKTITFAATLKFRAGTKIRFMNSCTNNNLTLVTKTPAAGNGPRIPSVIMSIDKIN